MRRRLLVATLVLASAPAARATDVRLGADMAWVQDSSFDAFWTNDLFSRFDVCLAYTTFASVPFRLDAELGYGYAGYLGATAAFAAIESELSVHDAYVGLRASIDPPGLSWLRPYVRVQGGATFGLASFRDASADDAPAYEDWSVGGLVYGGGGVELVLPLGVFLDEPPAPLSEPMAFGIFLEGGYFYRSALSFHPAIPAPEDEDEAADRIPVAGFSAGDVVLSGGELRIGFVARL